MNNKQFEKERHDMQMGEMFSSHVPTTAVGTMTKAAADRMRDLHKPPQYAPIAANPATPVEHTFLDVPLAVIGCLSGLIWAWIATSSLFPVLGGAAAGAFAGYFALPALIGLFKFMFKLGIAAAVVAVIYYTYKWLA